jgi:TIR domain
MRDLFISHASEDKEAVARPLFNKLHKRGMDVWYDESSLKLGDNLRREIDRGLAECRFGVVILSHAFFSKKWPQDELDGLAQKEAATGEKVILPVWHRLTVEDVRKYSVMLAGRKASSTDDGIFLLANDITDVVWGDRNRPDRPLIEELFASLPGRKTTEVAPTTEASRPADYPSEQRCPRCKNLAPYEGAGLYFCFECPLRFPSDYVAA